MSAISEADKTVQGGIRRYLRQDCLIAPGLKPNRRRGHALHSEAEPQGGEMTLQGRIGHADLPADGRHGGTAGQHHRVQFVQLIQPVGVGIRR